jgi:hypothetical protein
VATYFLRVAPASSGLVIESCRPFSSASVNFLTYSGLSLAY